jgi:hypothetical protein
MRTGWKQAAAAVGVLSAAVGLWVGWGVHTTPGGFEEWVGDHVSDLRYQFPVLIGPIETAELYWQDAGYRLAVWRRGPSPRVNAATEVPLVSAASADGAGVSVAPVSAASRPSAAPVDVAGVRAPPDGRSAALASVGVPAGVADPAATSPSSTAIASPGTPPTPPTTRPRKSWWFGVDEPEKAAAAQRLALQVPPVQWRSHPEGPAWLSVGNVAANPDFPDEPATALRFARSAVRVHWQPGQLHPWNTGGDHRSRGDASPAPDRGGRVPDAQRSAPIVAFGGGFESIHFQEYGGVWAGRTVVPLAEGIQTLAMDADGKPMMGPWGALPADRVVEARQNLPPLLHDGRIPDNIGWLNVGTLQARFTTDEHHRRVYADVHTWRSAAGLTAEGDLVYVAGARLTPAQLAAALLAAGAIEGMQLDINAAYHCAPTLFVPAGGSKMRVVGLLPGVQSGVRFIDGSRKDFFWISGANAPSASQAVPVEIPPPS